MNIFKFFVAPLMSPKAVILLVLLLSIPSLGWSIELPKGFVDEAYVDGMKGQVTGFDWADDDKVFIALKSGLVRIAVDGVLLDEAFIDLSKTVNDRVDRGLLSVAVHPEFPTKPYIYLLYTYDPPELVAKDFVGPGALDGNGNRVARLDRYTADASAGYNRVLAGSLKVIMGTNSTFAQIGDPEGGYGTSKPSCGVIGSPVRDCLPIDEMSHTIGAVRFASDGSLYVTNGDGASYHDVAPFTVMVQDLDSMRGKVFRVDAETGQGLPDNPYYDGDPDSNRSKVLNFGLRNPYSLAIHPQTGVPYVGEVGLDLWEEVNGGIAKNFAWPCYSGAEGENLRRPDFEDLDYCQDFYSSDIEIEPPVLAWPRKDAASAMVGDFYFANAFPEAYKGTLFYADFLQGWMRYADVTDPNNVQKFDFATDVLPLVELKLGADGALYYASITTGEIRRIRYAVHAFDNTAPNAVIFTSGSDGVAPFEVEFDASNSTDSDGQIVAWYWNFGNGQTSEKEIATTVFNSSGSYTVSLTVTDNLGASATTQTIITAQEKDLDLIIDNAGLVGNYAVGETVLVSGFAMRDGEREDGVALRWQANIYDGEGATTNFATSEGQSIEFVYPDHSDRARVQVCLQSSGSAAQICELLNVDHVTLVLDTYPTGQVLIYQSQQVQTPFIQEVPKGALRTVSPADLEGQLEFVRWSNRGDRSQSVRVLAATKLVANYAGSSEQYDYATAVSQEPSAQCLKLDTCWRFFSNLNGDVLDESSYVPLLFADGRYRSAADDSSLYLGSATSHSGRGVADGVIFPEYAIAQIEITTAGEYALTDASLNDQNGICGDGMQILMMLNSEQIAVVPVANGREESFGRELGSLQAGDVVSVAVGPENSTECDTFSWGFSLHRRLSGEVAPEFESVPESPIRFRVGEAVSLLFLATDVNGDTLNYTSRNLPDGLLLDAESGRLSGQVNLAGDYTSTVVASDGQLTTELSFVWEIGGDSKDSSGGAMQGLLLILSVLVFSRLRCCSTIRKRLRQNRNAEIYYRAQ